MAEPGGVLESGAPPGEANYELRSKNAKASHE